jgi:hypothetical protein
MPGWHWLCPVLRFGPALAEPVPPGNVDEPVPPARIIANKPLQQVSPVGIIAERPEGDKQSSVV